MKILTFSIYCRLHSVLYRFRSRRFIRANASSDILYVHCPKSAGQSIAALLEIEGPGHFTLSEQINFSGRKSLPKIVVMSVRDPVDRMISTFKYSRKQQHKKFTSPLYFMKKFEQLEDFVRSPIFPICVKHHYFFKSQAKMGDGIFSLSKSIKLEFVRFYCIEEDVRRLIGKPMPHKNSSSNFISKAKYSLTKKAVEILEEEYGEDIVFLKVVDKFVCHNAV